MSRLFITLVTHYLLISLHFALEFAKCPYRILQINYVNVDERKRKQNINFLTRITRDGPTTASISLNSIFWVYILEECVIYVTAVCWNEAM